MPPLSAEARNLNWLLSNFAKTTPGVAYALVVSADGLPITIPEGLDLAMADQLAAIASGLASLSQGAARHLDAGLVKQTVVEMERGVPTGHDDQRHLLPDRTHCFLLRRGRGRRRDGAAGRPRRRHPHPTPPGRAPSRPAAMNAQLSGWCPVSHDLDRVSVELARSARVAHSIWSAARHSSSCLATALSVTESLGSPA
jgi:hypothetical protein